MERHSISTGVLVVGAGAIADLHVAALSTDPRSRLAGFVDTSGERAAQAAHRNGGVPWSTDLAEALSWPGVDACIICTPNDTHERLAVQVATAGKHLLVEKPLATTVPGARKAAEAFAGNGLTLAVAHSHRFYDYARTVREEIRSGALGRPVLVRLALLGSWIWPDWRAWVLDPARSGGHALHNGVHLLDLVTWWIGSRPLSVYARGQRRTAAELDVHDYLEMVVRYESGATAVCEMSRAHRPAGYSGRDVVVQGTEGLLTLPWDGEGPLLTDERGTAPLDPGVAYGFAAQLGAWLDALTAPPGPAATEAGVGAEEALLAVALGVAAERSMALGRPVDLEEVL
ncbi:Gfo/Idh/MocA family oxidoreductase [Nonomuraea sp. NPDC046570]|uniref:Gfo/Idh/MocA family protein n=1 Tax=Nonomuraea sp. NPDC046570 TaxID=3155255 RepID=UPI0033CA8B09